jgi:hypothetical protein
LDIQKIVTDLKKEREQLDRAIATLEGLNSVSTPTNGRVAAKQVVSASPTNSGRRGRLTAEGRKRLSEAMKRRWAERRKKG